MEENNQQSPRIPQYPPEYYRKPRKSKWWIPVLVIGIIIIGFLVIFGLIASHFSSTFEKQPVEVTDNSILYITFDGGLEEYAKDNPFAIFSGGSQSNGSFLETINAIKAAANDSKIKGIFINPNPAISIGEAKAVELNEVLTNFKKSGKFIYAFMEVGSENNYFNILPADSIFMPTEGMLEFNGFGVSSLFFKDFFSKIGVDFKVIHFEDFKSAGEMFDRTNFSDSARAQLKVLLDQRLNYLVDAVSNYRKMDKQNVLDILNRGVYLADSMKTLGLIDVLANEYSVKEFLKYKVNGDKYTFPLSVTNNEKGKIVNPEYKKKLNLVTPGDYISTITNDKKELFDENTQIAIVSAVGEISSGSSSSNEYAIKSDDFIRDLRKARNNNKVKAIIIRIDSPGGSVIASDEIWEEIIKTKSVKPVYASMSNVAASGGYYMAMACDTIIAHPATITGSIGVVMAIPNLSGTMAKLGITADTISTGPAAQFMNGYYPYTKENLDQLYNMSKGIYYRFLNRVAESRKKSFDEIHSLAKGRVWTGEDAKARGLVDALGGIEQSIDIVKKRLGIPLDKKVIIKTYPEKEDEFEAILKMFNIKKGSKDDDDETIKAQKIDIAQKLGFDKKSLLLDNDLLPQNIKEQINYMLNISKLAQKEKYIYAMPYLLEFK